MSQPPLSLADAMELAHLYREHVGLCIRVARSVLGDPDEARDAAHEFFAQLAAGAPASLDRPLTKSFFRTAARNQAIKILERHRARQALVAWHLPAEESPRSNAGSVDEILLRFEQRQQAKRLIATLPPLRARVAELCLGRQLTSRQAAEELGVSEKAVVKQRLKLVRDIRRFRGGGKSGWLRGYWVGGPEYVEASDPGPSAESNWRRERKGFVGPHLNSLTRGILQHARPYRRTAPGQNVSRSISKAGVPVPDLHRAERVWLLRQGSSATRFFWIPDDTPHIPGSELRRGLRCGRPDHARGGGGGGHRDPEYATR